MKYDLNKESFKNVFKLSTRIKDQKFKNFLRLDYTYQGGESKEIELTEEASVKIGSKVKLALQEVHDIKNK